DRRVHDQSNHDVWDVGVRAGRPAGVGRERPAVRGEVGAERVPGVERADQPAGGSVVHGPVLPAGRRGGAAGGGRGRDGGRGGADECVDEPGGAAARAQNGVLSLGDDAADVVVARGGGGIVPADRDARGRAGADGG